MPILKKIKQHKVLFDTHIFIWHMFADSNLPKKFQKEIEHIQEYHPVLVSPMTFWEVGMLSNKGRIELEMDCFDWMDRALSDPGFQLAPLSPEIAMLSTILPGIVHADPVDRILIATAINNHAVLVTCDEKIIEYGKNNSLVVYNPQ